jgi:3-keto-5-aminohexanoate cleavage enzyme
MAEGAPVVIEAAINGGTTKQQQPHVPTTIEEVSSDIEASIRAGASIVHNHPGEGATGINGLDFYLSAWKPVLAERPDALLYPTFGFRSADLEGRWGHVWLLDDAIGLRIGPVDPGSVNLGRADEEGLPARTDFVYSHSFAVIRQQMDICVERGLSPHFSVFDPSWLRVILAYYWRGQMPPGAMIRLYFSGPAQETEEQRGLVTFGMPPTETSLNAYLAMMERCDLPWSVAVLNGNLADTELPLLALDRGGHLRVGLEDFHDHSGGRTPSNEELVLEMVALCAQAGRPVVTPQGAAQLLGIPPRG